MTAARAVTSSCAAGDTSHGPDVVTTMSVYVFVLTWMPSQLIFAPLGAAGTPAQVLAMLLLFWWCADRVSRAEPTTTGSPPVRTALLVFSLCCLASYLVAMTRAIDAVEVRAADRGMLKLFAWLGVVLVMTDLLSSMQRLRLLLRRLVLAVAGVAALGIFQFATGQAWVDAFAVPGLTLNTDLSAVIDRSGFARPAGTAIHPIEFGVVLTTTLPLALHFAFHDVAAGALRRWLPPALIALAVPLSISRSAILASTVVLLFLLPTWTRARRRQAYGALLLLAGAVYVAVPGLLGTLQGLFLGLEEDSSTQSRTNSFAIVADFVSRQPTLGRGIGTFLPAYRILDNQYLITVLEVGVIGLGALVLVILMGIRTALAVRRSTAEDDVRDLAQSLAAGTAAAGVSFGTFDGLAFPMAAGLLMLLLGSVGALYRLQQVGMRQRLRRDHQERSTRTALTTPPRARPIGDRPASGPGPVEPA